jgi:excisionase family DNA binding protein
LELITTLQAAELIGVHPATITRWVDSGKLRPVHKGTGLRGAFLFDKAAVVGASKKDQPAAETDAA